MKESVVGDMSKPGPNCIRDRSSSTSVCSLEYGIGLCGAGDITIGWYGVCACGIWEGREVHHATTS